MTTFAWLKLWNGAHSDPVFLAVADMAGSSPAVAAQTYFSLLEYANEREDRGSVAGFERILPVIAAFNRVALDEVRRIIDVLTELGKIVGGRIAAWAKRQELPVAVSSGTARSETSAARRSRRFREVHGRDRRQSEMLLAIPGGVAQGVASVAQPVAQPVARNTEKEKESGFKESSKGLQRSAPLELGRSSEDLAYVEDRVSQVREIVAATVKAIPMPRRGEGGKPSKEAIREALRAKHMRYLQATGRRGELTAYIEAQTGEPEEAKRVFDLVDQRMRVEGWDDKRREQAA